MKKRLQGRAVTSLMMLWALLVETVSGVVLYIVPPGRVANWTDWKLWGLTKSQWGALHTIFGYVMVAFGVAHIVLNRKPIFLYIRSRVKAGLRLRAEWAMASLMSLAVLFLTIAAVPPFGTIMDWGEDLKNSWEEGPRAAFQPHAEELPFTDFAREAGVTVERGIALLAERGYLVEDPSEPADSLARRLGVSPAELFDLLTGDSSHEASGAGGGEGLTGSGRGYRWKTLAQVADEEGLTLERALALLEEKGISAEGGDVLRDLAEKYDRSAFDLVEILRAGK